MKNNSIRLTVITVSLFGSLLAAALAQQGPMRDPLVPLKHALSEASAPALTATQEQQLNSLITAFRNAHQPGTPNTTLQSALQAYQAAILNGDNTTAQAQADSIANEQANVSRKDLKDRAKLEIDVLAVLKSNDDQVGLLLKRIGSVGLSRLLGSLAGPGGPGGPGRPPLGVFGGEIHH
ncbi:MAG TPA: hypothetical protein VGL91_16185 [Acidobacteriota bacterium]